MSYLGLLLQIIARKHLKSQIFNELLVISNSQHYKSNRRNVSVKAEARNIKVGIIDCYSGPAAVYGEDALNGFKLALQEISKMALNPRPKGRGFALSTL